MSYKSIGSSENEILKPRYYKMLNNILYISQSNNAHQLSVEYKAGLANEFKDLPSMVQLIIIEHVSHLYENRGMDKDFDIKKYDMLRCTSQDLILQTVIKFIPACQLNFDCQTCVEVKI